MKVYGVYVKFLSSDSFKVVGGMLKKDLNVLARTPAKNAANLKELKRSVLDMVENGQQDYVEAIVPVPYKQLLQFQQNLLTSMELEYKVKIALPDYFEQDRNCMLMAVGRHSNVQQLAQHLDSLVKESFIYRIPSGSVNVEQAFGSAEYQALLATFDLDYNGALEIGHVSYNAEDGIDEYHVRITCPRPVSKHLNHIVARLATLLGQFKVGIQFFDGLNLFVGPWRSKWQE